MKTTFAIVLAISLATGCATRPVAPPTGSIPTDPYQDITMEDKTAWTPAQALLGLVLLVVTVGLLAYASHKVSDSNRIEDPDVEITRIYYD
jgi:hypothetical protein